MRKLPVYFSHGYREREATFNKYFGILIEQSGFIPSLDPPSEDVNASKLEKHLRHTVGLIAIAANRDGNISPYIRYEIDLAIRSGKPVLVFIEDNLPDHVLPDFLLRKRFSTRSFFRDYHEHQHMLEQFKSYIGSHQLPRYQSLHHQRSSILLGFGNQETELEERLRKHLELSGYRVWERSGTGELSPIPEGKEHFLLSNVYLAICLMDDLSKAGSYYLGAIRSVQVPTILLTYKNDEERWGWIPREFRSRQIDETNNENAFGTIRSQIDLYEEDFVIVDNEHKWERYVHSMASTSVTNGVYSNEVRDSIITYIHMGDKFEHVSGNITKDVSGTVIQSGGGDIHIQDSFVQDKFGKEAADALVKVAELIRGSGSTDAKELFESMQEELKKEKPKKSLLSSIWTGITTAVPLIKTSTEVFEKVSGMIHGMA